MPIKVIVNTYPTAFITPGGGEIQLKNTFNAVKSINNTEIDISLYDMWNPNIEKADIVHFFSVYGGSLNFCENVKKLGKKLVISPVIWLDDFNKYPIDEIKKILFLADLILPNSELELEMLYNKLGIPREKMKVVYNATDVNLERKINNNIFKDKYIVNDYILNVANIEPRKNQLNLIKAVQNIDVDLIIAGAIRDEKYWEKCIAEDKNKKVKYIGILEHNSDMLLSAYLNAKCFVLPSMLETPGLAAIEAISSGCKNLVITGIGSAREYFKKHAIYINNPNDYKEIEQAILKSFSIKLIDNNYKKELVGQFNWENTAKQTIEAYKMAYSMKYIEIPDIYNLDMLKNIIGFYELEFDGKNYFRWMSTNAVVELNRKCSGVDIVIEAEENQKIMIVYNMDKCKTFKLKSGINNVSFKFDSLVTCFNLLSSKKDNLPNTEKRDLALKIIKIRSIS